MHNPHEAEYLRILAEVLDCHERGDRTGTGTRSVFGRRLEFDMSNGFPLMTRKKMAIKQTIDELRWFISGSTNYKDLPERTHNWWSHWASESGELGPIYGRQLRNSNGVDQLKEFVEGLQNNPESRRHIISLWNPGQLAEMRLPPCHGLVIQGYVSVDGGLSIQMYQRSCDLFLGLPVNIASYGIFLSLVATVCNLKPETLIIILGDAHIYLNHIDQVKEYLGRSSFAPPELIVSSALAGTGIRGLEEFTHEDLEFVGYKSHPPIKGAIAV